MTSLGRLLHVTLLGYTMIGLQEGPHTKGIAQTTLGYLIFKNVIKTSFKLIKILH